MQVIALLLALARAVPVIDGWLELLVVAYTKARAARMKKENREAVRKALEELDQRPIEEAMGHPSPGAPSGVPGAVIVDQMPGSDR